VVTEYLGEVLPNHIGLTMFGNLEVFFVLLSLLSHCFVILIKYSRAQKRTQASYPVKIIDLTVEYVFQLEAYI